MLYVFPNMYMELLCIVMRPCIVIMRFCNFKLMYFTNVNLRKKDDDNPMGRLHRKCAFKHAQYA